MNKFMNGLVGTVIVAAVVLEMGIVTYSPAAVRIGVNINLGAPVIVESEPPEVVIIPGTAVYYVERDDYDIFFYGGYWWSPRGGRWYRSRIYNGPWGVIGRRYVPGQVFGIPGDFRARYQGAARTPYSSFKKQWIREPRTAMVAGRGQKVIHKRGVLHQQGGVQEKGGVHDKGDKGDRGDERDKGERH